MEAISGDVLFSNCQKISRRRILGRANSKEASSFNAQATEICQFQTIPPREAVSIVAASGAAV
jgi:hypothetical protein